MHTAHLWSARSEIYRPLFFALLLIGAVSCKPDPVLEEKGAQDCSDGVDNDDDNLVDCQEETCATEANCLFCGNGSTDPGEACDDGNTIDTDACTNACQDAACGDAIVQAEVEACDDGNQANTDACTNQCQNAACGDGFVRAGVEPCDDGNAVNTDACKNDCTLPVCGDSLVSTGESCDDGNTQDEDGCSSLCVVEVCGDGVLNNNGQEACDEGSDNSDTTPDACRSDCTLPFCGDSVTDTGEECDDQNQNDTDACRNDCTLPVCGDGLLSLGEACDDQNNLDGDGCEADCTLSCGNGAVDAALGEACDDANQNDGDGCDLSCVVEPGFTCITNPGTPTACFLNEAPTATNDTVSTNEDTNLTIDVLANDTDADGDLLALESVFNEVNCVALPSGNQVLFQPGEPDFSGPASFDYVITDGKGGSATGSVSVNVIAVADPPDLDVNDATGDEDTAIPVNLAAFLVDVDGSESLSFAIGGVPVRSILSAGAPFGFTFNGFAPSATFAVGANPQSVVVADFNSDDASDLASVNNGSSDVSVLFGDGFGSFGAAVSFPVGLSPSSIASGDFNDDGHPDLVTTSPGPASVSGFGVSVLFGDGSGSFADATRLSVDFAQAVAVADLNSDGAQDLITANTVPDPVGGLFLGEVSVLLGNGDGTFGPATSIALGESLPTAIAVSDLNKDGRPDLVANNALSSSLLVLLGQASGSLGSPASFAIGSGPTSVAIGDLNGDSHLDLASGLSGSLVGVLLGNGDGTFGSAASFPVPGFPRGVAVEDLNGDSLPDLAVVSTGANAVFILSGDGSGAFLVTSAFGVGAGPLGVALGDFNSDTFSDLAVANSFASDVSLLLNAGATKSVALTEAELIGLTITPPPNVNGELLLTFTATATEASNGDQAFTSAGFAISINNIADCGDGVLEIGGGAAGDEGCDDRNLASGDGCDETCQIEPGFECLGEPSFCFSDEVCTGGVDEDRDGDIDCADDDCDGIDGGGFVCEALELSCNDGFDNDGDGLIDTQDSDCGICGNGILTIGESCDDGSTASGDGCSSQCQTEPGFACQNISGPGRPSSCQPLAQEVCNDGFDNDGDSLIDCADSADCPAVFLGQCSSFFSEVEDNNSPQQANGVFSNGADFFGGVGTKITITGRIDLPDFFLVVNAHPIPVRMSFRMTGNLVSQLGTCDNIPTGSDHNPQMALFDVAGNLLAFNEDLNPPSKCPGILDFLMSPGQIVLVGIFDPGLGLPLDYALEIDASFCGNGRIDQVPLPTPDVVFEECDDGNLTADATCGSTCLLPACGNGVLDLGEECDGSSNGNGGCQVDCTFVCGSGFGASGAAPDANTGNCYLGFASPDVSWFDAEAACEDLGGHLAVIDSAQENSLARQTVPASSSPWIGFNDVIIDAGGNPVAFGKVTGGNLTFDGFSPTAPFPQPDNSAGIEDCVHFFPTAFFGVPVNPNTWADSDCFDGGGFVLGYICELEAAPCGDGVTQLSLGEACDDGNTTSGDGCDASCQIEPGFTCTNTIPAISLPSVCN